MDGAVKPMLASLLLVGGLLGCGIFMSAQGATKLPIADLISFHADISQQQPAHGKALHVTRLWTKQQGKLAGSSQLSDDDPVGQASACRV